MLYEALQFIHFYILFLTIKANSEVALYQLPQTQIYAV